MCVYIYIYIYIYIHQLTRDMGRVNVGRVKCMCLGMKCVCLLSADSAVYYA